MVLADAHAQVAFEHGQHVAVRGEQGDEPLMVGVGPVRVLLRLSLPLLAALTAFVARQFPGWFCNVSRCRMLDSRSRRSFSSFLHAHGPPDMGQGDHPAAL
ncbi:hypothetical protein, partial [Bifidobacterium longum]|uniref:hypothetical protein n=1 Tax=Bifidobacterium longum TaxID=216816 RepID=UPI001F24A54C